MLVEIIGLFLVTFFLFFCSGFVPWIFASFFSKNIRCNYFLNFILRNMRWTLTMSAFIAFSSIFFNDLLKIELMQNQEKSFVYLIPLQYGVVMGIIFLVNVLILLVKSKKSFS